MLQLSFGLCPHPQNHAYYAGIMLDAFAHLNYASIIDSGLYICTGPGHVHEMLPILQLNT